METKTVKLYSLDYSNARTYLMAALFIAGNMALPQLFHLIPQGGITWLPIYFFTLIGAYKFGWKVKVCRNARCTFFLVYHYTNRFIFFKLR